MSAGKKSNGFIIGIMIFFVILGFIGTAAAYEPWELQWAPGVSGELYRGDELKYMGYSVKAVMFPPPAERDRYRDEPAEPVIPFVGLNISKNGSFISTIILGPGETYILEDGELKITVKELPSRYSTDWLYERYNPKAKIELNPRGTPSLGVLIYTDKSEHNSGSSTGIVATVIVENTGKADAVNVNMNILTGLQINNGSSSYHYEKIRKGESIIETITYLSPMVTEQKMYRILANVSGYDVKGLSYKAESSEDVSIVVEPMWSLSIRKVVNERIYLKDFALVSLSVKNNGKSDIKNVSITDSIPDGFKVVGNTSLNWTADIPANRDWDYRYLIKPEESIIKGTLLPAAIAEFKVKSELYRARSNRPKLIVDGPKIELSKQTDVSEVDSEDTVTVTITAINNGNTPTRVEIKDELPDNATLVDGGTSYNEYLEANKSVSFSYVLKLASSQNVKFPPATATYYELGTTGRKVSTMSEEIEMGNEFTVDKGSITYAYVPDVQNITSSQLPDTPVTVSSDNEPLDNSTNASDVKKPEEPRGGQFDIILKFIRIVVPILT